MENLKALLGRLTEHDVGFVLIGAFASTMYGTSLVTEDVDICCSFTTKNLLKLQKAVADLHPIHRLTPQELPLQLTPTNCRGLKNLHLKTDLGVLDCLSDVLGVGNFPTVKKQSVLIEMDFGKCRVLSLNALIKAKRAMNRPRDREAIIQLEAIKVQTRKRKS